MKRQAFRVRGAVVSTVLEASKIWKSRGDEDIRKAGNFGPRWTRGFRVTPRASGGDATIVASHDIPYWTTHQFGATIKGKPLLWIPLDFARDAKGVRARDYPAPLFRVDRQGKAPLLLTTGGVPKYFGKERVRVPKRFHLIEIGRDVSKLMGALYQKFFKAEPNG